MSTELSYIFLFPEEISKYKFGVQIFLQFNIYQKETENNV